MRSPVSSLPETHVAGSAQTSFMAFIPETNRPGTHTSGITDNSLTSMALVQPTNRPLTDVSGISDNTLTATAASTALGAVGGIGLGACLGLAPGNILGVALAAGALLGASSGRK